jgi:hypothetical protein
VPQNYDNQDEEEKQGITPGYKMRRDLLNEGERLDTVEGEDDNDDNPYGDEIQRSNEVDRIEATLDDVVDDDDNESLLGLSGKKQIGSL